MPRGLLRGRLRRILVTLNMVALALSLLLWGRSYVVNEQLTWGTGRGYRLNSWMGRLEINIYDRPGPFPPGYASQSVTWIKRDAAGNLDWGYLWGGVRPNVEGLGEFVAGRGPWFWLVIFPEWVLVLLAGAPLVLYLFFPATPPWAPRISHAALL